MDEISVSDARENFSELLSRVKFGKERIVLKRGKKEMAVLVSLDDLALLEKLEEELDLKEANLALKNPANKKRVSWDDVKKKLGL